MSDYPRFEVYRKAGHDESNDTRVSRSDVSDLSPNRFPYENHRSPFLSPREYDFDTLEAAKDALHTDVNAADLLASDYYILKISADDVEVAYGDPTVDVDGEPR